MIMKRSNSLKRAEKNSTGAEHSRRSFLKASLGVAGGAAVAPLLSNASIQSNQKDLQARERLERQTRDPRGRILIKGATILSMDPQVGDFLKGDLLIEGKKIVDVKPQIKASAEVLDASGTIMVPGFAD